MDDNLIAVFIAKLDMLKGYLTLQLFRLSTLIFHLFCVGKLKYTFTGSSRRLQCLHRLCDLTEWLCKVTYIHHKRNNHTK